MRRCATAAGDFFSNSNRSIDEGIPCGVFAYADARVSAYNIIRRRLRSKCPSRNL